MKTGWVRIAIPLAILVIAGVAHAANLGLGTLSSFGWEDISVLCPIGALNTMLASKMAMPRALLSLVLALAAIVVLGRAFCAWVCPVSLMNQLRKLIARILRRKPAQDDIPPSVSESEGGLEHTQVSDCEAEDATPPSEPAANAKRPSAPSNARYIVLAGSLLSAAVFGFPVFCLICPIGLSFALVFSIVAFATTGDITWSLAAIPVLLILETLVFGKWCSHICPVSAFMSLVGQLNRTWRPHVDKSKCLEASRGVSCGHCAKACEWGCNPRLDGAEAHLNECSKCRVCAETCPAKAISLPLLPNNPDNEHTNEQQGAKASDGLATLDKT